MKITYLIACFFSSISVYSQINKVKVHCSDFAQTRLPISVAEFNLGKRKDSVIITNSKTINRLSQILYSLQPDTSRLNITQDIRARIIHFKENVTDTFYVDMKNEIFHNSKRYQLQTELIAKLGGLDLMCCYCVDKNGESIKYPNRCLKKKRIGKYALH